MTTEKRKRILEIENFLSIDKAEIHINDLTLLIGPQAAGKSVIAKLIYFYHCIPNKLFQVVQDDEAKRSFDNGMKKLFAEIFPPYSWSGKTFKICYRTSVGNFCIGNKSSLNSTSLIFNYDNYFKNLIYQARYLFKKLYTKVEQEIDNNEEIGEYYDPAEIVGSRLARSFSEFDFGFVQSIAKPIFIPSGRSFFSNIQNNVFSFLSNNIEIDYFLKEFGSTYNSAKQFHDISRIRKPKNGLFNKEVMKSVLGGEYRREKRKAREYIQSTDGRLTNVANASSGQQESLPMLLVLSSLPYFRQKQSNLYIIEEPEAHLFPQAQKQMVELIVGLYNSFEKKNSYIITTHSPYVLAVLNVLAKAGRIRKQIIEKNLEAQKIELLDQIIPQNLQIEKSCLTAYLVSENKVKSITDADTGLVNDEIIDEVSEDISKEFEGLLGMEEFECL